MCGIGAIFGPGAARADDPGLLARRRAALERLAPRGPDGEGEWTCDTGLAWLGHRRLAIVDLSSAGAQPMANEDGSLRLICNGEIYNAPALREQLEALGHRFRSRSDNEVLIHACEQWGARGALERVRGMFAVVLWDARDRRVFAAVDHAGMKPLVYAFHGDRLFLASTCDALIELLGEAPGLQPESLCHVLCHGYVPGHATVWKGVQRLGPGEALEWAPGQRPRTFTWWSPGASGATTRGDFASLWHDVVREHLLADVPVRLLLSGGLDSAAVAAAVAEVGADIACLTLGLDRPDDESSVARATAEHLGLPWSTQTLGAADVHALMGRVAELFEEPQGYGALITMTAVAQAARSGGACKVLLSGDGGDEAFAGYTWHREALSDPRPHDRRAALASAVASPGADGATRWEALRALASLSLVHAHCQRVAPRMHPAEAAAIFAPLRPRYDEVAYALPFASHDDPSLPWPRRAQRLDLLGFCAGSILPKVDRATMGVGLELRAPFLDRRVLEWALAQPVDPAERDAGGAKPIIRRYLVPRVPRSTQERPKQGFSLRTGGPELYDQMLERLRALPLVEDGYLCADWERFVAPDVPYRTQRIFTLTMLGLWHARRAPCASHR